MRLLILFLLLVSFSAFSQSLKKKGRSYGIGVQVFEPTGFTFQSFKGFFNDNNSSLATFGVWEVGVGKENLWGIATAKQYNGGNWMKGGVRVDINYLHPILTLYKPFVFQTYVGAGLQTGSRMYSTSSGELSNFATGANLMLRVEYVAKGFDLGRAAWFFSIYADIKYHTDFTESFDYVSPVVGMRVRRGR